MKQILYMMQVHGQANTVTKGYSAFIPDHLAAPEPPDAELKALFRELFLERWDSFMAEKGPFGCAICGGPVKLIKN